MLARARPYDGTCTYPIKTLVLSLMCCIGEDERESSRGVREIIAVHQ